MVTEARYRRLYRTAAGAAALGFLLLVVLTVLREGNRSTWKKFQETYRDTLSSRGSSARREHSAREYPVEVRQISIPALQRTDRCVSCHVGIEDARMKEASLPYRMHSGTLLATHPPERFGCTVCHGGIGQSLDRKESCGADMPDQIYVPFVSLHDIESSCGKCHIAIFDSSAAGMPTLQRGRMVFRREGCLGCHRVRGKGGSVGPDLTNEGSKSLRGFDFTHVSGPLTISNWMRRHFMNPAEVSPGSVMPAFALPGDEIEQLVMLVRGLFSSAFPPEYVTLPLLKELKGEGTPVQGREGFAVFCSACHGSGGKGREFTGVQFGVPSIGNMDFQSVASDDFLRFTIVEGRGGRMMASWSARVSHIQPGELREIADTLRRWRPSFRPIATITSAGSSRAEGEELFGRLCVTCHGSRGEGDLAKEISNPDFLSQASDRFLLETIMKGRSNTAMPSWSRLTNREMRSLIVFLRGLQRKPVQSESAMHVQGDFARGDSLFSALCTRCHGKLGEGDLGPAILNRDFQSAASDGFLFETISRGREHTPMFGWTQQSRAGKKLVTADISDVIAYMRGAPRPDFLPPGASQGDPASGSTLFRELCSACHGEAGEGKKAPALRNQEFLGAATNGYLLATITLGRGGTPMPPWGRGSQEHRRLTGAERKDIVAYIRSWQSVLIRSEALR